MELLSNPEETRMNKDEWPLGVTFKNIEFPTRFMVAGGMIKSLDQSRRLIRACVMHELGSINTAGSSGNGGRDYYAEYEMGYDSKLRTSVLLATYNSVGLTNPGMAYTEKDADEYIALCASMGLPAWLNVSGNGVDDSLSLLKRALKAGFKVITVNGACPNKPGQPIICNDVEATEEFFDRADKEIGETDAVVLWKVSCAMQPRNLSHNRQRMRTSRTIDGIITGNTEPDCLMYREDGSTGIKTANGITRGGKAGPAIHGTALSHTAFMAEDLPEGKILVGAGGARNVRTVVNFIRAGATLVQCASAWRESGEDVNLIRDVNLNLVDEFKGESVVKL